MTRDPVSTRGAPEDRALPLGVGPGDLIAGKYVVEHLIGRGGMGVVVAARHVDLDERVAIKLVLPERAQDPHVMTRFLREARTAVKIKSEHVVRIFDFGRLPTGEPFMVMEHLQGADLSDLIASRGPRGVTEAVQYVLHAYEALAEAHRMGIVHRDLKPANLFRTVRADGSPCVKVLDFGIAKLTAGNDQGITRTGVLMGSALYMSPEQLRSPKDVDARADIWALGVILYELLAGAPPFEAGDLPALVFQIVGEAPPSLRARRPDLPVGLEAVILRCLAKEPGARFASVVELAEALAPFATGREGDSAAAPPPALGPGGAGPRDSRGSTTAGVASDHVGLPLAGGRGEGVRPSRRSWLVAIVGTAMLVTFAGAVWQLGSPWPTAGLRRSIGTGAAFARATASRPTPPAPTAEEPPVASSSGVASSAPSAARPTRAVRVGAPGPAKAPAAPAKDCTPYFKEGIKVHPCAQ